MRPFHESIEPRLLRAIILVAVLVLVLLYVRLLKRSHPPSVQSPHFAAIEVRGDVRNPGIYLLAGEAPTIVEALKAAGWLKSGREAGLPRGAADGKLESGRAIRVEERLPGMVDIRVESMEAASLIAVGRKIDVNAAGEEELSLIPRMKPEFARAIVDRRREKAWRTVEELEEIPGVGRKTVEKWEDYLEAGAVK